MRSAFFAFRNISENPGTQNPYRNTISTQLERIRCVESLACEGTAHSAFKVDMAAEKLHALAPKKRGSRRTKPPGVCGILLLGTYDL